MLTCTIKKKYHSDGKFFDLNVTTTFKSNQINVLFGVSGSGKTSLLRLISGLDVPDKGLIKYNNEEWYNSSKKVNTKLAKRNIAYVFQDYALFPNMSVLENLRYANKDKNELFVNELVQKLQIKHIVNHFPSQLSGGQKQRVAIARAVVQKPDVLLLDEPLTAIDETLRLKLQEYLKELQKQYGFTIIMVSHNLQEVLKVANHVVVINYGEIIDQGASTILVNSNPKNTLQGVVLEIKEDKITILVSTQSIVVDRSRIQSAVLKKGDSVVFNI